MPPPSSPSSPLSRSARFEGADGAPKLGWHDTVAYLTIPLILVITQSISTKIMQPKQDPSKPVDESQAASQNVSPSPSLLRVSRSQYSSTICFCAPLPRLALEAKHHGTEFRFSG